jgi:hypothetical protein
MLGSGQKEMESSQISVRSEKMVIWVQDTEAVLDSQIRMKSKQKRFDCCCVGDDLNS